MGTGLVVSGDMDLSTLEKVVVNGDLSKLSAGERLQWYRARCEAAGLDPRTQPFQYLSLQGKLTLYATKAATDQLIASRKLTVEIVERTHLTDLGVYEVRCRVTFPDGRHVEDVAALNIAGLKGDALCNAVMKCVTKAKRRTVLSACGLGMLDEMELETIAGAERVAPDAHHAKHLDNQTGHGRTGAYASAGAVAQYREWRDTFIADVNGKWLDALTGHDGEIDPRAKEIITSWQLSGHLLKWGREKGLVQAPEEPRTRQYDPLVSVIWERHREALVAEATRYGRWLWRDAKAALAANPVGPQDDPGEPQDVSQDDADPEIDCGATPGEPVAQAGLFGSDTTGRGAYGPGADG